ncbi:MAG: UDP-N-acetylglucosamine 2-epimerase [Gammaproteobacteria bacterium]
MTTTPVNVAVITTSRADFGHIVWPVKVMQEHPGFTVEVIAIGAHLSPSFGNTVDAMEQHGITANHKLETLLSSDSDTGMAKTIGVSILSLSDLLSRIRPDILLVTADRYEMLAAAATALALRIPIAHVEGGEISAGAIDDAVRNALTKLSHIHFAPHEQAAARIRAMGEETWRVCVSGAPSLDHLKHRTLLDREQLTSLLNVKIDSAFNLISFHPVTLMDDTVAEAEAFYSSLESIQGQMLFCFPNCDAGSHQLIDRANRYCERHEDSHVFVNLDHWTYWSLLHQAKVMLGNSSSALMEAPSAPLPAVNIGERQRGRLMADNVIDCPASSDAIVEAWQKAVSDDFTDSIADMTNPYGDGQAATRMCEFLLKHNDRARLLDKKARTLTCHDDIDGFSK